MMVAKELDIPLNLKYVDLMKGEQLAPDFVELNPHHCLPTIDDNGFILWESGTISAFLVNKYSPGHDLYPTDPEERAAVERFLYSSLGMDQSAVINPQIFGKEVDPEKEKQYHCKLDILDSYLEGKQYLVGEKLTLADLHMLATLSFTEIIDYDLSSFANITEWIDRLKAELSYYEEINGEPIKQFKELRDAQ